MDDAFVRPIRRGREDLVEILALAAVGKVTPMLEIYPLDAINDVMARLVAGDLRYRAVLTHEGA